MNDPESTGTGSFSRRTFPKGLGTSAVAAVAAQTTAVAQELEKVNAEKVLGPGPVPVTLIVNGRKLILTLEPRVTLLDALRNYSSLTGAKGFTRAPSVPAARASKRNVQKLFGNGSARPHRIAR